MIYFLKNFLKRIFVNKQGLRSDFLRLNFFLLRKHICLLRKGNNKSSIISFEIENMPTVENSKRRGETEREEEESGGEEKTYVEA